MPVISITLLPGYGAATEARLVERVAIAVRSVIAAPAAGTTVFVRHASTYLRDGRVLPAGRPERADASALVRRFLESMQERDLPAARQLLAADFQMQFPGSGPMRELSELVEFARGRYRNVAKDYERFDECWTSEGAVVYCHGHLRGTWLDGSSFAGIRFIDRFEVVEGLITRQDVWNDLALHPQGVQAR